MKLKKRNKFKPFLAIRKAKNWIQDRLARQLIKDYAEYYQ